MGAIWVLVADLSPFDRLSIAVTICLLDGYDVSPAWTPTSCGQRDS